MLRMNQAGETKIISSHKQTTSSLPGGYYYERVF